MRTLKLDGNDLRAITVISGPQAVSQSAKNRAQTLLGEMVLDMTRGVTYMRDAFGASPKLPQLEASIRRRILETPEVLNIETFRLTLSNNSIDYVAELNTSYGIIRIQNI